MWVVVPLKSPDSAKSRLSPVLTSIERRRLFFSMARHVLETLRATPGITGVAVVTANSEVERFAHRQNAFVIRQTKDAGTAAAFTAAVDYFRPQSLRSLLMISGDLPLLTNNAVRRMFENMGSKPCVTIAPDRCGLGTNALCCSPPDAIRPSFGVASLRRHLAIAWQRKLPIDIVRMPELALDLDVAADLRCLGHRSSRGPLKFLPMSVGYGAGAGLPAGG